MYDNAYLAAVICDLLKQGSSLVLASIVMLQGSSPRHNGAKMVVTANGKSYGTIGGSLLEAAAIKEAGVVIASAKSSILEFDLNGKDANSMGMICGGRVAVFLDYIASTPANELFFLSWYQALQGNRDLYFLTNLGSGENVSEVTAHSFMDVEGESVSDGQAADFDMDFLRPKLRSVDQTAVIENQNTRIIVDPIRKVTTVYLFGAGHVAVPTAHIASLAGFRVMVLDDRVEYASRPRFPDAHEVIVLERFDKAMKYLEMDVDSYIVIFTRGHLYDRQVLEQALKTQARYIGMISSRRKRDTIYAALLEQGFSQSDLDRVHAPIGVPIGGETPEEIAVSIVAELIRERNKRKS